MTASAYARFLAPLVKTRGFGMTPITGLISISKLSHYRNLRWFVANLFLL